MNPGTPKKLEVTSRYVHQNTGVSDVYDALIELITNGDDRYVLLKKKGISKISPARIEIEVERKRGGTASLVRVRDFADGMTADVMEEKLCQLGKRISGMAEGHDVRGTNSRGAKDVAFLGGVIFESIAEDGKYHKCEINRQLDFIPYGPSKKATSEYRKMLGIPNGTGTTVTVTVDNTYKVPQHDKLRKKLRCLVSLREIISDSDRQIILRDLNQLREDVINAIPLEGKDLVNERFKVPGYPDAEAKLVINRAKKPFENQKSKFRLGGIRIRSRRAVHETTLFDQNLETDPNAAWYFGKLTCEYIDDLWNDYDERYEKQLKPTEVNPQPIVDPMRKAGMRRDHPFTKALFAEALKRLRPLVEEERKRQEKERVLVESEQTRKRLNILEKAAAKFMQEHTEDAETSLDPNGNDKDSVFLQKGFSLNPQFAQVVVGQSIRYWLNISQEMFPGICVGDIAEITCQTNDISSNPYIKIESHPNQEGVLRAVWLTKGIRPTKATQINARVGSIRAESQLEVLESEKSKYENIKDLMFKRNRYSVTLDKGKSIEILAPYPSLVNKPTPIEVKCSDSTFKISGQKVLVPKPKLGIAICKMRLIAQAPERTGTIEARLNENVCTADIRSVQPSGAPIIIKIENIKYGNQRYCWKGNVLEIAAKHSSISRYLGPPPEFPKQEEKHFRVLLAEIVAEAVCARVLSKNLDNPEEKEDDQDWDYFYAEYTKLLTEFLPIAHETQVQDP